MLEMKRGLQTKYIIMTWWHFLLHFHTIPEHRAGQLRPLIHHESWRSLLKTWIVLIYLHWLKCSREKTLLLAPVMLAKVLAAPPLGFFPVSQYYPIYTGVLSHPGSVFKQDVPEDSCDSCTRIYRRLNYSPVTRLASTGSHPEHCSPPGSFWSSISLVWLMFIIAMQFQWWARHPREVGIPEVFLVLSIRLAHKTPWMKSLGRSHCFIKLQNSSLGS